MGQKRTEADLSILQGQYRSFEWYWDPANEMPALDAYEQLTQPERISVIASFRHWASIAPGDRPLESRVNIENVRPLIVAAKAGQHRFFAFCAENDRWVVAAYARKKSEQRGKSGDREVKRAKSALEIYAARVGEGTYYKRK